MVFRRSGDEILSLALRDGYQLSSEDDLKSPFSDIPTFLYTNVGDENNCDYSKLEDLDTPTPLDSMDQQFHYEYLNFTDMKMEEPYARNPDNTLVPIRQARSVDEFPNLEPIVDIKSEYVDESSSDYTYYVESHQETCQSETPYSSTSYTTDPTIPCSHVYLAGHHDMTIPDSIQLSDRRQCRDLHHHQQQQPLQTHDQQPYPHQQHPNEQQQQIQYQSNYYQPCYIEPYSTTYYSNTPYITNTPSATKIYPNPCSSNSMSWDMSGPMYSPDSGICTTSPNTQPSPYPVCTSSYSNRSDIGDLDSDILRLTTTITYPITTSPLSSTARTTTKLPNHLAQSSLARQISAPMDNIGYNNNTFNDAAKLGQSRPRVKIDDSQKPFLCGMNNCPKRFVRVDELKRHQRTHSGVKQFVCEDCQKGFTRSDHLTTHRRTHTGERPYACSICDRRFARSDEKNRHEKTHSKERSRAGRKPRDLKKFDGSTTNLAHSL